MTTQAVRVTPDWLALRESADAAARAAELVDEVRMHLPSGSPVVIHDLGCGTGSMVRWLAPQLVGPQQWILYDRDGDLLEDAARGQSVASADGLDVTIQTRQRDITRLGPGDLERASLITASALLDMFNADELDRFVATCAGAGCPVLITISVVGNVELSPSNQMDPLITEAFNAHQRREIGGSHLLGPDAVAAAASAFTNLGFDVVVRPSPWLLGPHQSVLAAEWLTGWIGAACEQEPQLAADLESYAADRLRAAQSGQLTVTVHHQDLLARPR
jgi:trans-aconitate methyltransferase